MNSTGLLPKESGPEPGEFPGYFPRACIHTRPVKSALYLAHAQGRRVPDHALASIPGTGMR